MAVDEIATLHLHAVHQHEILPGLIKMFPNVQFIVTTLASFCARRVYVRLAQTCFVPVYSYRKGLNWSPNGGI